MPENHDECFTYGVCKWSTVQHIIIILYIYRVCIKMARSDDKLCVEMEHDRIEWRRDRRMKIPRVCRPSVNVCDEAGEGDARTYLYLREIPFLKWADHAEQGSRIYCAPNTAYSQGQRMKE